LVMASALAVVAAAAAVHGYEQLAILSVGAFVALSIFGYLGLSVWCSLLLIATVAARGLRGLLGLPEIVDFIHFGVVVLFAVAALDRLPRYASLAPRRWLAIFLLVVVLSAVAHPSDPMRSALFLLIAGEALVVIWAIARWGTDPRTLRTVGVVALLLGAVQLPLAVYQGATQGWGDPVQGTLSGHGAGAHVFGALFALALFIIVAGIQSGHVNRVLGSVGVALSFGMMLAAGSLAVLVVATVAAFLEPFLVPAHSRLAAPRRTTTAILIALLLGASVLAQAGALFPGLYERAVGLATSPDQPGLAIVWERATSDPLALLLGSGPGTSASRASLLLVDPRAGSPLDFIGVEPTDLGTELLASTSSPAYGGSVESAASSALGVLGDLGLVGLAALGMLLIAIWRGTGKSRSWLAPAARSALLMVAVLSLVDNWLEYPEFATPFAILIGCVLSDVSSREAGQMRQHGR
jgi:hypothetical protein